MSEHKAVRRYAAQHDLFNRLHSIAADEGFVRTVAGQWYNGRFEVVANQRCGNWYCDPSTSSKAYAYFKSTDGHMSHWDFNLRRSNLSFAKYSEERGGVILVDSTRKGKRMPDGLSKTVPIWCAAINLALALRRDIQPDEEWDTELYLPPQVVPPTERAQIEERLDEWAEALEASTLPLPDLSKPLRPFFVHPSTSYPPQIPDDPPYTPIICLSASRWVGAGGHDEIPNVTKLGERTVGFEYVPGGGDDDELWSRGLTPPVFHSHKSTILAKERDDLPEYVDELVLSARTGGLSFASPGKTGQEGEAAAAASSSRPVGIPEPASRIALDIGQPISGRQDWVHSCLPADTGATTGGKLRLVELRIFEVDKYPKEAPYLLRSQNEPKDIFVLATPSAKVRGKEYDTALRELVGFVRSVDGALVMRPGTRADVDRALTLLHADSSSQEQGKDFAACGRAIEAAIPGPSDRKLILPLALVILCLLPSIANQARPSESELDSPQTPIGVQVGRLPTERKMAEKGIIDKAYVADRLHQLVALWPDGNPPRAALKRVNEFLMSDGRRG
ncbi:tRNA '-O-ribosylphosphate transferase [Kwoniella heveanensis BCC8398]|uniref:tRNA '-O-ribosylphosphate transferase n=1 Tax=Kwoniella heveanensis BCC8398 TaxID=1296120 RepID=A0A1B9GID3_9TREE|nr:tRNA '-O-ribosylphosphate transferase [Kwoniella heveanensis BCC8398]